MRFLIMILVLIVILFLAHFLLPPEHRLFTLETPDTEGSVEVQPEPQASPEQPNLRRVPDEQLQLVKDVFAPELEK